MNATLLFFFLAAASFPGIPGQRQTTQPSIRKIDQQLIQAVEKGAAGSITALIGQGANVNARTESGDTPLHLATTRRVAELLISKGADVNAKNDDFQMTPIFNANLAVTEVLIARGAGLNAKAKDGITPLGWTVYWDMLDKAKFLISKGADVNGAAGSKTPLQIAANWGKLKFAELLLSRGADVNARDNDGWTALHWAAFEGGPEIAGFLIAKGADKNARTAKTDQEGSLFPGSSTPLDIAEKARVPGMAEYLRSQGCKRGSEIK